MMYGPVRSANGVYDEWFKQYKQVCVCGGGGGWDVVVMYQLTINQVYKYSAFRNG
jgi:hypothetical protein